MTTETIILRHKISKVAQTFPADYARDLLADPHYGTILEEVRTEKPEVLSQPFGEVGGAEGVRPANSDLKQEWLDYAATQGFEGDSDSISKAELIEQYGADKDKD